MIDSYVRPQTTITQLLRATPTRATSRRNPLVIGPQFQLYLAGVQDLTGAYVAFDSAGASGRAYTDARGVSLNLALVTPQASEAKLYGANLEALVASYSSNFSLDLNDPTYRTVRVAANNFAGAGTLNSLLEGRAVRVGDVLASSWATTGVVASGTSRRRVVGLAGKVTAAVVPASVATASPYNPTTTASLTASVVTAETTSGLGVGTPTLAAADVALLRAAGKVLLVGNAYKLLDQLDIECTLAGAPGTAEFKITSLATGVTATAVASTGTAPNFSLTLVGVGYAGPSTVVITRTGNMVVGEKIRVLLQPAFTPSVTIPTAGTYTPKIDRRYAVEVTVAGSSDYSIKVYDVAGADPEVAYSNVIASGALALGTSGLTINPAGSAAGVRKGDIYYLDVVAAKTSSTEFTGIILDAPPVPTVSVQAAIANSGAVSFPTSQIFQTFSGVLDDSTTESVDSPLTAGTSTWAYSAALGLSSAATGRTSGGFSPFATGRGSVYLSFRALVKPGATEGVIEISSETDIPAKVGTTDMNNWLGRGTLEAFKGNQSQVVYALRTNGDTVEAFRAALKKIQTNDRVYALAGMTDREDVMELLRAHCEEMSNKFTKNFRRAYVGTDSPGAYAYWGELSSGGYRTGDLASSVVTLGEDYRADSQFTAADVGSTITVQSIGQTYNILEVISDFEVLTDAPNVVAVTGSNLVLTRADTAANAALFVADRSARLNSRRIVNVWCDDAMVTESGVTKILPSKFIAAEIAGLRCALLPQQGMTMTEILSVDAAPSMYTTFDPAQLDAVAANGTFVVTQESEGGSVFVRHQLTTSTNAGALASEDNVGVIVDEFGYAEKDLFRSYIGRRNATPDTIAEIDDKLKVLATSFTQVELVNKDIGPPVLAFFDEKDNEGEVTVRQDGDLADTLMTYVRLRVPLPLNGLNNYIDVEVSELLASPDN